MQIDAKKSDHYIPYIPIESHNETGVYELIFYNESQEWTIYLGQGLIKHRIDKYGQTSDSDGMNLPLIFLYVRFPDPECATQCVPIEHKPRPHLEAFRTALSNGLSIGYRAWLMEKSRAFLVHTARQRTVQGAACPG